MEMLNTSETLISFPPFPADLARKYEVSQLFLRPFGIEKSDLAVDFSQKNLPHLITGILEQCSFNHESKIPEDFFLDLSVGKRIESLLVLASSNIKTSFSFPFKCESCGVLLELELTLGEIAEIQKKSDLQAKIEAKIGDRKILFRKPSGRDQKDWQSRVFADDKVARQTMLRSLQINPKSNEKISPDAFSAIDEAFDEADPLINFFFRTGCSECEKQNDFPIDLSKFALDELYRTQKILIWTTHRLASHYHWSEKEIFEVPYWRRMQYLELISDKK